LIDLGCDGAIGSRTLSVLRGKFRHGFGDPFSAIALLSAGIGPPSEKI
jgi:hypothetical protein